MDWLVQAFGLPHEFTFAGGGGGSTQGTTSDGVFYVIAAAREAAIGRELERAPTLTRAQVLDKLVVYASVEVRTRCTSTVLYCTFTELSDRCSTGAHNLRGGVRSFPPIGALDGL